MNKINKLKTYKEILYEIKKLLIIYKLGEEVENKIPTYEKSNVKVKNLTRFKNI